MQDLATAAAAAANWLIGAAGGLGTLVVAWLVYRSGRQQAAETHSLALRQHSVEHQALRLALLDRRLRVIEALASVSGEYWRTAKATPEMIATASRALRDAGPIFAVDIVAEVASVADALLRLHLTTHRVEEAGSYYQDDDMREKQLEKQFAIEDEVMRMLNPIVDRLREATRISEP
jgi:hypothetical protein